MTAIRVRVTLAAAVAVALVLVAAGYVIVRTLRGQLIEDVDDAAIATADALAADLAGGSSEPLAVRGDDDNFAQLVVNGRVVASSASVVGFDPIDPGGSGLRTVSQVPHDDARFRVLTRSIGGGTLVVGVTLDDVDESVTSLRATLLVTSPVVLAALAYVVWIVVGRTLAPVEASHRRQRRFVADASHELRSPLTRIRTELEVDLSHPARADHEATHRIVLAETVRLQALVDDLLLLARLDDGASLRRQLVDLDDLVLDEARRLRDAGSAVDVSKVSGAQVHGDPVQLARVVANLAGNAARHARSRIGFDVSEADGWAVIGVTDDGPGIPEDQRDQIFERFTRLDAARSSDDGGTGLGLAIVRDVVERHGGTVRVDDTHGPGARVVVRLPSSS